MAEMTVRERLMTALRGGVPDRVPAFPDNIRWLRGHYGCTCPRHQLQLAENFGFDAIINFGQYTWQSISNDYVYAPSGGQTHSAIGFYGDLPNVRVNLRIRNRSETVSFDRTIHTPAGDLHDIIEWARPNTGYGDGPNPHRVESLVKTAKDLEALRFLVPPLREDLLADLPLFIRDIGSRAVVAAYDCTHAGGWGLEVLGVEERLLFSLTDPALLHAVCRLTQEVHLRNLRAMLERGCEVVFDSWFQCGLSVGWSPQTFADLFLPLVRETAALAHEYGAIFIFYDAGKMMDIVPSLVEAGVDALSGLQPPPLGDVVLRDIKRQYGKRIALVGGLDPCYVFDLGSPDRIRQAVRQAIADAGPDGGYIVGTALAAAPETPEECLWAAARAVREFGVYGRDV